MSDHKSYAGVIKGLLGAILVDCTDSYPNLAKEFRRDSERLNSAIDKHGIQFALITMPAFGKHLDRCLSEGRLTPSNLNNFGVLKDSAVPRLFRGLLLRVFDREGSLKSDADTLAIRYVRQLLGVGKRMRLACSDVDVRKAVEQMISTDSTLPLSNHDWLAEWTEQEMLAIAHQTFAGMVISEPLPLFSTAPRSDGANAYENSELLDTVQRVADLVSASLGVFTPTHWRFRQGPGAVSDNHSSAYKYDFPGWSERLESVFPYDVFALANHSMGRTDALVDMGWDREVPARLIAVPKVLDKPRLIASEPTANQWCQQSLRSYFYERTKSTILGCFVDYTNQRKSGDLALKASIDGSLSTVDLSEASDRISLPVVERLFRKNASLLQALRASRSAFMVQRIHKNAPAIVKLRKYSTMGNATTFPVQSTLFTVLAIACCLHVDRRKVSNANIARLRGQVRVFGDDIIIPTRAVGLLLELLPALGLKVNTSKTFVEGNFRESCGVDAFRGVDVTPVRVLDVPEVTRPGTVVSTVDVHNNFLERGMLWAAAWLRKRVPPHMERSILEVERGSGMFGFKVLGVPDNTRLKSRWHQDTSRRQFRALSLAVKQPRQEPNASSGLLQFFTESHEIVTAAMSSIGHAPRRPKTRLSLGWVAVDS